MEAGEGGRDEPRAGAPGPAGECVGTETRAIDASEFGGGLAEDTAERGEQAPRGG